MERNLTAPARRKRHRQHGNPFTVRGPLAVPDWEMVFGRRAPFALEVGFGGGAFLLELARRHPEWNVLGLEIRRHFVETVNAAAAALGLSNMFAVLANANEHLSTLVPPASTAWVTVNFPDPWYKKRHHKRRVVRADWVATLATVLAPGAEVHLMTDYEPVARETRAIFEAHSAFENLDGRGRFAATSTTGIESERERTHLRRGEPIYRLRFRYHCE